MRHIFLHECDSTQSSFKQYWLQRKDNNERLLVSCDVQLAGLGRRGNQWFSSKGSLTLSASLKAQKNLTLSPLAIGLGVCKFFKTKNKDLRLKWPNDLLNTEGEKVGGILCQTLESNNILAGIGINLLFDQVQLESLRDTPYKVGHLDLNIKNKKELAEELYQFLIEEKDFDPKQWDNHCLHKDKEVSIIDGDNQVTGIFRGIDNDGAAIIENNTGRHRILTGSLRILSGL